jgi:hypothetical protein
MKRLFFIAMAATSFLFSCKKEDTVKKDRITFEELTPGPAGYYIGEDGAGSFTSGNASFPIHYSQEYQSWSGFAYSNHTDATTPGVENQFSAVAGGGADNSSVYAVYYSWQKDTITFDVPETVTNISLCNSTYAYYAMKNGDQFSKKFGGASGNDPDYFKLIIEGLDADGNKVLNGDIMLADFTSDDNSQDFISNAWTDIDLSKAGPLKYLVLSFDSSDKGPYGINTPLTVCIDNIYGELQE